MWSHPLQMCGVRPDVVARAQQVVEAQQQGRPLTAAPGAGVGWLGCCRAASTWVSVGAGAGAVWLHSLRACARAAQHLARVPATRGLAT